MARETEQNEDIIIKVKKAHRITRQTEMQKEKPQQKFHGKTRIKKVKSRERKGQKEKRGKRTKEKTKDIFRKKNTERNQKNIYCKISNQNKIHTQN